jgi:ribosomal protein S5
MTLSDTQRKLNSATYTEELLTVEQVQKLLKVGRTFAYSLIRGALWGGVDSGRLPSVLG